MSNPSRVAPRASQLRRWPPFLLLLELVTSSNEELTDIQKSHISLHTVIVVVIPYLFQELCTLIRTMVRNEKKKSIHLTAVFWEF